MTEHTQPLPNVSPDVAAGAAVYTRHGMRGYDWMVLDFISPYLWRCPKDEIQSLYNQNVSGNHLDVGVGSGLFIDTCRFPTANPKITLADLSPNCLGYVADRIRRYQPKTVVANVLDPLPLPPASFESIGLNFVLHCVPGPWQRKAVAFKNLRALLKDGGVLFGATLLGKDWTPSSPARFLMNYVNKKGGFSNLQDDRAGLEAALAENFKSYTVRMVGGMALFVAKA